jgi:hypothetical protein
MPRAAVTGTLRTLAVPTVVAGHVESAAAGPGVTEWLPLSRRGPGVRAVRLRPVPAALHRASAIVISMTSEDPS